MVTKKELFLTIISSLVLIIAITFIFITHVTYDEATIIDTLDSSNQTIFITSNASEVSTTIETIVTTTEAISVPSTIIATVTTIIEPTTILITETTRALRYGFSEDEIYLLAQLICGDEKISGDGEYDFVWNNKCIKSYYKEMSKILCVIMNQQRDPHFADNVTDVIMHPGHFTPMPENLKTKPSKIAINEIRKWCQAYDNYDKSVQIIPEDHIFFSAGPNNTNITRAKWR